MNYLGLRAISPATFSHDSVPTGTAYEVPLPRHSCSLWPRAHPRAYTNTVDETFARLSVTSIVILLDGIPNLNRVALGNSDNATQIRICILKGHCNRCGYDSSRRRSLPTFCVHFESDTGQHSMTDHNCSTETPWETRNLDCNLLAYRLTLDLQTSLRGLLLTPTYPVRTLFGRIRDLVVSIAASCTSRCIVCDEYLGCQISRATSCYDPDCWDSFIFSWPLSVRLSPLLRDPSVLDLLLTLLMGDLELKVPPPGEDPDDYALTVEDMKSAINSFPAMHAGITTADLVGRGRLRDHRRIVLEYVCCLFEGMLVPTPRDSEVPSMSPHQSFLLLNTNLDRQAEYEELQKKHGCSFAAFKGVPPHQLFECVWDGINFKDECYYSNEPAKAAWYIPYRSRTPVDNEPDANNFNTLRGWRNSRYKNIAILLGLQVAGKARWDYGQREAKSPEEEAMVRYLFLLPANIVVNMGQVNEDFLWIFNWVNGSSVMPEMEATYQKIQDGRLIGEVMAEARSNLVSN